MKTAIIIGATSGIGKSLAVLFVKNNYKVAITGRRAELLHELQQTNLQSFITAPFDVQNTEETITQLEKLSHKLGKVDLIIYCSGTGDINDDLDFSIEKRAIDTNVTGFTNCMDWSYNYFKQQNFGHLVAISSIGGLRGGREAPAYNATKAYQISYLQALQQKVKNSNSPITITDVRPGLVDTVMAKGEGLYWIMPVEKTVNQIYKAIKAKKSVAYVTNRWKLIAIFLKLLPNFIYNRM